MDLRGIQRYSDLDRVSCHYIDDFTTVKQIYRAANPPDRGYVSFRSIGLSLTLRTMRFSRSRVSLPVLPALSLKLRKPYARMRVPRRNESASSLVRVPVRLAS